MEWTFWNIVALLLILVLLATVPVLHWYFHVRWLWATAPVWCALILLVVALVVAVTLMFNSGLDIG